MFKEFNKINIAIVSSTLIILGAFQQLISLRKIDSLVFFNRNQTINDISFTILLIIPCLLLSLFLLLGINLFLKPNFIIRIKKYYISIEIIILLSLGLIIILFPKEKIIFYTILFLYCFLILDILLYFEQREDKGINFGIKQNNIDWGELLLFLALLIYYPITYQYGNYYVSYQENNKICEKVDYMNGEYIFTNNGAKKINDDMVFKKNEKNICLHSDIPLLNDLLQNTIK